MLIALQGAVSQGVLWGIMVLGVFITFRLLDIPDMTCDGSFALGGCVCAVLIVNNNVDPLFAVLAGMCAGAIAGAVTGILTTVFEIPAILAGILTQISLWSINLRIMGKSNTPILAKGTVFSAVSNMTGLPQSTVAIILGILLAVAIVAILYWFFGTEIGSALRATGNNEYMIRALGVNTNSTKMIALVLSNALIGLSGALICQSQKYADIGMGTGAIVIGLAAIVIGEVLGRLLPGGLTQFSVRLASAVFGSVVYFLIRAIVLQLGMDANDMKLLSAVIVAVPCACPWFGSAISSAAPTRRGMRQMLKLSHVKKTFNKGTVTEKRALTGVDLTLNDGDFVTVIGGNGAGKSTLLNMIAGVYPLDSGVIELDGTDISRLSESQRAKYLGRVFQDPMRGTAADMQIAENLALAKRRGQRRGLSWGVTKAEKDEYVELLKRLDLGLDTRLNAKVGLLSGGQRQALTLLMATLTRPRLLLLDEHTAALDPKTASKVLNLTEEIVDENHLTTLMVTHNMNDAIRLGNRLIMMHEGHVIYDVAGDEKKSLTVADLLQKFEEVSGGELANDRMLLS